MIDLGLPAVLALVILIPAGIWAWGAIQRTRGARQERKRAGVRGDEAAKQREDQRDAIDADMRSEPDPHGRLREDWGRKDG